MNGTFVTFEGTEGTGKSTQVALLAAALTAGGARVVVTREPGGTAFGARLRSILLDPAAGNLDPYAELFCYLADRAQHVREVIAPALAAGAVVICDRFADATLAYQGDGRGLDPGVIAAANERATGGLRPDLTLLLDLERVEEGVARARRRQAGDGSSGVEDRFEREEDAFHRRVRGGYLRLAREAPGRIVVVAVDGRGPEAVHARVLAEVAAVRARGAGAGARA